MPVSTGGDLLRAWRAEVAGRYPHPGRGFTQGLIAAGGPQGELTIWESTGLYGQSALCRYRLGEEAPRRRAQLDGTLFGEGICRDGAYLWQLTWQDRIALRWDAHTLELVGRVPYDRAGWGICAALGYVVTSDGSSELVRRDPGTLRPWGVLQARARGAALPRLNDLAWSGGRVWANVAGTCLLAGIDLDSGEVTDVADARAARERRRGDAGAIMNGIAALPAPGEFLLTGKTYRSICHVRLVPARARASQLMESLAGVSASPRWLCDRRRRARATTVAVMTETWTAPQVERTDPGRILGERQALEAWLDFHRDTLLAKCAGLTAGQLRERPVPPSRLSLLGLVRHMTEVERWWFRMNGAGLDLPFPYDPEQNGQDFEALDDADAAANIAAFQQETEQSRAAMAGKELDDVVPSQGHHPERTRDIRWIYLHMIEEYARHNGHADLIRERIDGVTGE